SWHGFSQSSNTEDINRAKVKYRKSLQYNDYGMAKNAIYDLMVLEPSNYSYLDSLAYMYYEFRQYASAALVSKDALKYNANNQMLLQIAAQSFNELGAVEQSMQMYQRLYNVSDDAFILYEVANKQYELKNYQDALLNTELLLGKPMVTATLVKVKNSSEDEIEILFKAVIFNLQGLIAKGQGNDEDAKKYFNSALKVAPNYALPKENLNPSN
ncbi:MAG: tetratricopeptide (TPR) repeat protein, partial [Marivirga sp.]